MGSSRRIMISMPVILLASVLLHSPHHVDAWSIFPSAKYDYDLVIVGAGASGLFAAGTASSIGYKTLLIEQAHIEDTAATPNVEFTLGGDCTNAACVPSKAVRSIARMAATSRNAGNNTTHEAQWSSSKWLHLARLQANEAVGKVRAREDPSRIGDVPNLDLEFVQNCHFVDEHKMRLVCFDNSTLLEGQSATLDNAAIRDKIISGGKFIIATGASPIPPETLTMAARDADVPFFTYRSLLRPNSFDSLLNNASAKNIVIVGGGATACELGQSLSRLGGQRLNISIVAPAMLPSEDVAIQNSAVSILYDDKCNLYLGSRAMDIIKSEDGAHVVTDYNATIPVDCIVFCTGRSPESSLDKLHLDSAGVAWSSNGVTVNSHLQSTARHIYACGDCASAVFPRDRRAIHAGWTGFGAVRNALLPQFLHSCAAHPFVPRVTYTDPELASAGLSLAECIQRYGVDGFDRMFVAEGGTDRADVESRERSVDANFLELRAEKIGGRILGASACGPAAAEIINEVCLAMVNRLTVRHIARTLHSYPSHGYLLYRGAMALATQRISGLLAGCGPVGRILAAQLRMFARVLRMFKLKWLPWRSRASRKVSSWQAAGASNALLLYTNGKPTLVSFLDAYNNSTLRDQMLNEGAGSGVSHGQREFLEWLHQ